MDKINDEEAPIFTCNYGSVPENAKLFDMKDILKDKMLNYKISKIKYQLKSNEGIYGIQFIYRNLIDGKESTIINIQPKGNGLIEQEIDLSGEDIINMNVFLNQDISLIGFEIITNKNKVFKIGYGNDEQIVKIPDLTNLEQIVVGFGLNTNEDNVITSIYGYYINRSKYIFNLYKGILYLRKKLENEEYNEKIQKKINNMNKRNQLLYRICSLPQNQFFNIMKFTQ